MPPADASTDRGRELPKPRLLEDALVAARRRAGLGIVAEVKVRSSDGRDLLRGRSPAELAAAYARGGAVAISVVTGSWFGGSLRTLEEVARAGVGLPLLRKDFIRSDADLDVSKGIGADAVLLTRKLLPSTTFWALVDACRQRELEPFVEVSSAAELDDVRTRYRGIVAINNADIVTRERTGEGVLRSVALKGGAEAGNTELVWVSASQLQEPAQVRTLAARGFHGALVGTHLLLADDLDAAISELVNAAR